MYVFMNTKNTISYQVTIKGHVQGVGFREWTIREASKNKISGCVRNCDDGSVLAVISGPPSSISNLLKAFEVGPKLATVLSLEVQPCDEPVRQEFYLIR